MRHRVSGRKLRRTTSHRLALLRNLVRALFLHERIETTLAKAKEMRRYAERMITLGKSGDIASRRRAREFLQDRRIVSKLFDSLSNRYKTRQGGYTRIIRLRRREGDGALLSLIELVDREKPKKPEKKKAPSKKAKADSEKRA